MGTFIINEENGNSNNDNNKYNNNNTDNNKNIDNKHNIQHEINLIHKERKYIWIDKNIENEENKRWYKQFFTIKGIECKKCFNIDEGFNFLNEKGNYFKEIFIIISGKLFNDFYKLLKDNITSIKFSPTIIIFTSIQNKVKLINQLKMNNIYYDNDLFDKKLIFSNPRDIYNFIQNKIQEESELTFDIIDNNEQLIIPCYYSYLFEDVNISDIYYFNDYLLKNFIPKLENKFGLPNQEKQNKKGDKEIYELINQIKYKKLPKEIIIKYWLRIYTLQSYFFVDLNKSLRSANKQVPYYYPFIKLCYEGVKKGFLKPNTERLFRRSKMSKKEFEKIRKKFNSIHDKKGFPKLIVFSRSFLSFSTKKEIAKRFGGEYNQNFYSIFYIIQEINNIEKFKNQVSNADIKDFSKLVTEKEVLLFPFSCFEISDIKEKNSDRINFEINLKYIGSYSKYIEEQFDRNYFDKFEMSIFSEEIFDSGILKFNKFLSTWFESDKGEIKVKNLCFFLEGGEDCIGFKNKEIIVFNISFWKIKQKINIHQDEILDIVKITNNRIISTSKDGTVRIIKLYNNNTKSEEVSSIKLINYAVKILFLYNEDLLFVDNENNFKYYKHKNNNYNYDYETITNETKILKIKELTNDKIIYISEKEIGNKFINIINLKEKIEKKNIKKIEEKSRQILKVIDLLVLDDYVIIGYNFRIDIFNYKEEEFMIKSLEYFDFELTNIIFLCSNRIILGLYNSQNNESIIREINIRAEDIKENKNNNYCIGQGNLKLKKIKDIIKIDESQILTNIENESCIIFKRKNAVSEELKKSLMNNNINTEIKFQPQFKENKYGIVSNDLLKPVISEQIKFQLINKPIYGNINHYNIQINDNNLQNNHNNRKILKYIKGANEKNLTLENEELNKENLQKELYNFLPKANNETIVGSINLKKSKSFEKIINYIK